MIRSTLARTLSAIAALPLLAACASGGGGGGGAGNTNPPVNFTIGQPPAATAGTVNPVAPVYASTGGPGFAAGSPAPAVGTAFPLTQSVMHTSSTTFDADQTDMQQGASLIVTSTGTKLSVPSLGINTELPLDGTPVSAAGGQALLIVGTTDYAALGSWGYTSSTNVVTSFFTMGFQTPDADVPTTGTATYSGTGSVFGAVFAPATSSIGIGHLSGDASLNADFAAGTIAGTLSNMMVTDQNSNTSAWNDVSLSATFDTGAGTKGKFDGTTAVTSNPGGTFGLDGTATGSIDGYLYGPNAGEAGATWTLYDGTKAAMGTVGVPKTGP